MKATTLVIGGLTMAMTALMLLHLHINLTNPFRHAITVPDDERIVKLSSIIEVQNETITLLENVLADKTKITKFSELVTTENQKDAEIASLMLQIQQLKKGIDIRNIETNVVSKSIESLSETDTDIYLSDNSTSFLIPEDWGIKKECSLKYGMELVSEWKKNKEIWCENEKDNESENSDALPSSLICYPYHQAHKQLDGRGEDMFCEARNFFVDFSKVHGTDGSTKPMKGDQYLHFDPGSLSSTCKKTPKFRGELFMPHHKLQMDTFDAYVSAPVVGTYVVQDTPTYLLARDEDCENAFHSTADFMNVFLALSALGLDPKDQQVMLFDQHPDGPYIDLIQRAFSPTHSVIRHDHYEGKKVLFKRLIFHLESPAGLIFPKVSRPDPLRCYDSGLFQGYRKFVLHAFGLMNVPPPAIPTLTLTLRYRTPEKNVGRVLKNAVDVAAILNSGNMLHVNVVDTAKMSFYDQLKLVRGSNIIIGVHGAGLMFIMFAAEEAILVELHPSYRQDRHFRHAARMTGKIYMPLRSQLRELCIGSSDDVLVPLEEFRYLIDGAVRIARSFDDGLSECGLSCPLSILALDGRLDPLYAQQKMIKGAPLDTSFPCY